MSLSRKVLAVASAAVILTVAAVTTAVDTAAAAEVTRRTILPGTRYATTLIEIDSGRAGPTVWISGGVHGSELAGWKAAEQIAGWDISRGRLIVVPHANRPAVEAQRRSAPGDGDLNRQFPTGSDPSADSTLASALWRELRRYNPDWVFDLHEALGNRNLDPDSVGQTIIVHPTSQMTSLAQRVIGRLNRDLPSSQDFQMLRYPVQGSLARAAGEVLGTNAAIVETSRRYPLSTRINWHLRIMRYVLEELNMDPQTSAAGAAAAAVTGAARLR